MPTAPAPLDRRGLFRAGALTVGGLILLGDPGEVLAGAAGETLYNGIRLPAPWPPHGTWKLSYEFRPIGSSPEVLTTLALLALSAPNTPDMGTEGKAAREKAYLVTTGGIR